MRSLWLRIHRWIGILFGPLLVLVGLTGSVLVFDHAIDEWLNPQLLLTRGSGEPRPLRQIIAAAEDVFPSAAPAHAHSATSPRVENGVWTVWFSTGSEEEPTFTAVHVDPYTAKVTGQRVWGEDLMSWLYRLHFRLLAGSTGAVIVGFVGILLLCSVISGVLLWWPLWRNSWKAAFAVRGGKRFNYDLHKTIGIVSALFLSVIAFTGVYMEFPEWVKPLVTTFSKETPPPTELRSAVKESGTTIEPEEAIAVALSRVPDATFCHFHPPADEEGVYEVALRQPDEVQQSFGRTQLFLDQYTGDVLAQRRPENFTTADAFLAWQFPLHNGEAFGLVGRWLVFVTGFTPLALYVTGAAVWLRKRRSRTRQRSTAAGNERFRPAV